MYRGPGSRDGGCRDRHGDPDVNWGRKLFLMGSKSKLQMEALKIVFVRLRTFHAVRATRKTESCERVDAHETRRDTRYRSTRFSNSSNSHMLLSSKSSSNFSLCAAVRADRLSHLQIHQDHSLWPTQPTSGFENSICSIHPPARISAI